jgi:hypothetical protein
MCVRLAHLACTPRDKRTELDTAMEKLLHKAEQLWLGGLKGILVGKIVCPAAASAAVAKRAEELAGTAFARAHDHICVDTALLEVVLTSANLLSDEELQHACVDMITGQVGSHTTKAATADVVKAAEDAALAVRQSFDELCSGYVDAKPPKAGAKTNQRDSVDSAARGPTVLLLGPELQQLPWESFGYAWALSTSSPPPSPPPPPPVYIVCNSCGLHTLLATSARALHPYMMFVSSLSCRRCLRGQAVTRMPCLPFVLARVKQIVWHTDPGVQPERTFYVINPSGDLPATQARLVVGVLLDVVVHVLPLRPPLAAANSLHYYAPFP